MCYFLPLIERNNSEVEGKFSNMFNSMWWTLVNLNGEFPINEELTPWGKVCFAVWHSGIAFMV